jgi:hypothetical protein
LRLPFRFSEKDAGARNVKYVRVAPVFLESYATLFRLVVVVQWIMLHYMAPATILPG